MPALPPRSVVIAIPPFSTTASAVAEPMAPAAPVTSTILSLRRPIVCSFPIMASSRGANEVREPGTPEHRRRKVCRVGVHGFRIRGFTPAPRNDKLPRTHQPSVSNIGEIAVAALALGKASGARGAFALEHRRGAGPFRPQALTFG